jgi:hypothetical protein
LKVAALAITRRRDMQISRGRPAAPLSLTHQVKAALFGLHPQV